MLSGCPLRLFDRNLWPHRIPAVQAGGLRPYYQFRAFALAYVDGGAAGFSSPFRRGTLCGAGIKPEGASRRIVPLMVQNESPRHLDLLAAHQSSWEWARFPYPYSTTCVNASASQQRDQRIPPGATNGNKKGGRGTHPRSPLFPTLLTIGPVPSRSDRPESHAPTPRSSWAGEMLAGPTAFDSSPGRPSRTRRGARREPAADSWDTRIPHLLFLWPPPSLISIIHPIRNS
jgi:hypothetical protein